MRVKKGVVEQLKECDVVIDENGRKITSTEVIRLLDCEWHGVKIDYRFARAPYAPYIVFAMTTSSGSRPGNVLQEGLEAFEDYIHNEEPWLYEEDRTEDEEAMAVAAFKPITKDDLIAEDAYALAADINVDIDMDFVLEQLKLSDLQGGDTGLEYRAYYIGDVTVLLPSGKYYTPFARSNVSDFEAELDQIWWEKAEQLVGGYDCIITNGEGAPTDIVIIQYSEEDD